MEEVKGAIAVHDARTGWGALQNEICGVKSVCNKSEETQLLYVFVVQIKFCFVL